MIILHKTDSHLFTIYYSIYACANVLTIKVSLDLLVGMHINNYHWEWAQNILDGDKFDFEG